MLYYVIMNKNTLIVATNNANKAQEIKQILGDFFYEIKSLKDLGLDINPVENGSSFFENAVIKAKAVYEHVNGDMAVIADDSGLIVKSLGEEPGVMSARYAGIDADDNKNNQKLLDKLEGVADRSAYFVCTVVLLLPDGKEIFAESRTCGEILKQPEGTGGFGYDSLFFSYDLKKSFGIASFLEKNQVSHRARALKALKEKFIEYVNKVKNL